MSGIPARVAAGFSPGSYNKDTREYRVRDLDAHSWVEVWFTGIGWVPFDPSGPLAAQSQVERPRDERRGRRRLAVRNSRLGVAASEPTSDASADIGSDSGGGWVLPVLMLLLLVVPLAAAAVLGTRARRLRTLSPEAVAEATVGNSAARSCGWAGICRRPPRCSASNGGSGASPARPQKAYAGALRANRYDPRSPSGPSLRHRRALRRELSRGSVIDQLTGILAIPPGAPRS